MDTSAMAGTQTAALRHGSNNLRMAHKKDRATDEQRGGDAGITPVNTDYEGGSTCREAWQSKLPLSNSVSHKWPRPKMDVVGKYHIPCSE